MKRQQDYLERKVKNLRRGAGGVKSVKEIRVHTAQRIREEKQLDLSEGGKRKKKWLQG